MIITVKSILLRNAPLKVISLMLGVSVWYLISNAHPKSLTADAAISFYNVPENFVINAPEQITLELSAKRKYIHDIDTTTLAAHIDATILQEGTNIIPLTDSELFLPQSIKLVHYTPSTIVVQVTKKTI